MSDLFGKRFPLGDQRAGPDKAVRADRRAVEDNRPHPNQRMRANRATVQNDVMTDHAIRPDGDRKAEIGVQRGIVLNLRTLAEFDPFVVAAQHGAEPDAAIGLQPHLADD